MPFCWFTRTLFRCREVLCYRTVLFWRFLYRLVFFEVLDFFFFVGSEPFDASVGSEPCVSVEGVMVLIVEGVGIGVGCGVLEFALLRLELLLRLLYVLLLILVSEMLVLLLLIFVLVLLVLALLLLLVFALLLLLLFMLVLVLLVLLWLLLLFSELLLIDCDSEEKSVRSLSEGVENRRFSSSRIGCLYHVR